MNTHLTSLIKEWIEKKKTGKIVINFFKGGISSVNKEETIKLYDKKKYETR